MVIYEHNFLKSQLESRPKTMWQCVNTTQGAVLVGLQVSPVCSPIVTKQQCHWNGWGRLCFLMQCCCLLESSLSLISALSSKNLDILIYLMIFCFFGLMTETDEMFSNTVPTVIPKASAAKQSSPTDNSVLHFWLRFQPLITVLPLSPLSELC